MNRHVWTASDFSVSDLCAAMVMRDGGGDQCGLPVSDPCHQPLAPSVEVIAFSLMVEEPGLPVDVALNIATYEVPTDRLRLVEPAELLRLAAKAYTEEQQ